MVSAACCLLAAPDIQLAVGPAYNRSGHHCASTIQRCACLPGVSLSQHSSLSFIRQTFLVCFACGQLFTFVACVPADPIIDALDSTGAELPDRTAYEKDYKVCGTWIWTSHAQGLLCCMQAMYAC